MKKTFNIFQLIKQLKSAIYHYKCRQNYENKIKHIRQYPNEKKIKVLFLIRETSKWTYESLYRELEKSKEFEPMIAVSLLKDVIKGKDTTRNDLEISYEFFQTRGYNVVKAVKNNKYIDLKTFEPDIVFYDQPWLLPQIHSPFRVSNFALTAYCPYSFELLEYKKDYKNSFHYLLWCYFVDNELNLKRFETYSAKNVKNCQTLGYPKLDVYVKPENIKNNCWKNSEKTKIIYAPHHSFEQNGLRLATFTENGKFILDLAKKYSDKTTWIFKPHPRLTHALLKNKIMTRSEIDNYYKEWEKIGTVYTKGDYFDIFKTSDLMITDCGSFLCEYLLTGNPIIQLINKGHSKFNALGEKITSYNYKAYCCEDIKNILTEIINKKDYNKEKRQTLIKDIIDIKETSASKIYKYLLKEVSLERI